MPKDRYFFDKDLKKDEFISIQGQEASHINFIMRKKKNDFIELINGKGILAKAKILNISKNLVEIKINNLFFEKEKKQKIILIQSIIKSDRLDLIFEKCTELGSDEFWLFKSKNSKKINFTKNKLNRIKNIFISAIKQCGRLYLPKIKFLNSIEDLKNIKGQFFLADLKKDNKNLIDSYKKNAENIFFIIGPESGFTKEELNYFEINLQALPIKLNENILRSETAAITSISIISHLFQV